MTFTRLQKYEMDGISFDTFKKLVFIEENVGNSGNTDILHFGDYTCTIQYTKKGGRVDGESIVILSFDAGDYDDSYTIEDVDIATDGVLVERIAYTKFHKFIKNHTTLLEDA